MGLESKLARLQSRVSAHAQRRLPNNCVVEAPTLTDDGHGGKTQTWAALNDSPLPCFAYPGTARKELLGQVPTGMTAYTVIVQGDVAVQSTHRVKVHARGTEPERIVKIVGVIPQQGVIVEIVGWVKI